LTGKGILRLKEQSKNDNKMITPKFVAFGVFYI